jgi:hypothetical protein
MRMRIEGYYDQALGGWLIETVKRMGLQLFEIYETIARGDTLRL